MMGSHQQESRQRPLAVRELEAKQRLASHGITQGQQAAAFASGGELDQKLTDGSSATDLTGPTPLKRGRKLHAARSDCDAWLPVFMSKRPHTRTSRSQLETLNFAGRGLRQIRHEFNPAGIFVRGQLALHMRLKVSVQSVIGDCVGL